MQLPSDPIALGAIASLLAGTATGLGAIPVLLGGNFGRRTLDIMLGFAGGVMLAASAFSLLIPALNLSGAWITAFGFALGGIFVHVADKYIPHEHEVKGHEGPPTNLSRIWLIVLAITIHNFPEGLAVGVAFGTGDTGAGLTIALAIGLQNIPEGLAVAMPLVREGYSRGRAAGYALLSGLVEPIGGILGVFVVSVSRFLLPYGLAFAAGAMVFIVSDEMVPESHSGGFARAATAGLMLGFIVMMILDTSLG